MTNTSAQSDHDTEIDNKIYSIGERAIFHHPLGDANYLSVATDVIEATADLIIASRLRMLRDIEMSFNFINKVIDHLDPEGITK